MAALQAGGKSVQELVEYCKTIQKKEKKEKGDGEGGESTDSESAAKLEEDEIDFTITHPYALAEKAGIVLNIPNSTPLPVNQLTTAQRAYREAQLRTAFPVSSGKRHDGGDDEWTPVQKAIAGPADKKAIMPPPAAPLGWGSSGPSTSTAPLPLPAPPPPPVIEPPKPVFVPPPVYPLLSTAHVGTWDCDY